MALVKDFADSSCILVERSDFAIVNRLIQGWILKLAHMHSRVFERLKLVFNLCGINNQ
jgi:hypothetical protein